MENKNICIDLNKVIKGDVIYYPINELIHREQIMRVGNILLGRMKEAEEYTPGRNGEFKHQTDIISVFARRGAGKTTFVQSLIKLIQYSNEEPFSTLGKDLYCLELLDPNNTERKENLTIRLIAQIHHVFQKAADNIRHKQSENYERVYNDGERLIENFDSATQELYKTLPVLDGIGNPGLYSNWDDSVYLSDRFMELTINASKLEKCFHLYLDAGLRLIQKKALLFVLDDCDIKINNTFQILEIIRLYFTSPQIIIIMTGDASLYGMAIRKHFWQYFDKDFLDKEMGLSYKEYKFKEYQKMVNRLEAQYFQKMIRAEYRIFLNNLYDKIQNNLEHDRIEIKYPVKDSKEKKQNTTEITELYEKAFNLAGISRRNYRIYSEFLNHMLAQPFRNQMRFFIAYSQAINAEKDQTATFVRSILKIFEVYINQYSGDSKFLMGHSPIYPAWMLKFLVENNLLFTGSTFLPEIEDDSLKNIMIALGFSFSEQIKYYPSMIFDFWLRISLTRQILLEISNDENSINIFVNKSYLYTDFGLNKILGNMTALAINKKIKNLPGILKTKKTINLKSNILSKYLILLLQQQILSDSGEIINICSIYRIFAFLEEILREGKDVNIFPNSTSIMSSLYWELFNENAQIRLYMVAPDRGEIEDNHKYNGNTWLDKNDIDNKDDKEFVAFYRHLQNWVSIIYKQDLVIPPYWLDHVFTHFYHTIYHLDSKLSLGEYISNLVLAFWNSLIVEGFYANSDSARIQNNQEGDIRSLFFNNYLTYLSRYKTNKKIYIEQDVLIEWFLYCPILHKYINPLISQFIIIARLHLEDLCGIENDAINLIISIPSEIKNFAEKFSEDELLGLYKEKLLDSSYYLEINDNKRKFIDVSIKSIVENPHCVYNVLNKENYIICK